MRELSRPFVVRDLLPWASGLPEWFLEVISIEVVWHRACIWVIGARIEALRVAVPHGLSEPNIRLRDRQKGCDSTTLYHQATSPVGTSYQQRDRVTARTCQIERQILLQGFLPASVLLRLCAVGPTRLDSVRVRWPPSARRRRAAGRCGVGTWYNRFASTSLWRALHAPTCSSSREERTCPEGAEHLLRATIERGRPLDLV